MVDHVYKMISIPPKYSDAQVIVDFGSICSVRVIQPNWKTGCDESRPTGLEPERG